MDNLKQNTDLVFEKIHKSNSLEDLKKLQPEFLEKYYLNTKKFPQINFKISKQDINKQGGLSLSLSEVITRKDLTTLEKLMLSMLWKNGDFGKETHVLEGILNKNTIETKSSGIVFHQFGQYLRDSENQPIIDQHIFRAFKYYKNTDENQLESIKKKSELSKKDASKIKDYMKWANEHAERINGEKQKIFYQIDKLLFALGKYIKKK